MYCIIDVETTGGNKFNSKITEIAIYRHDGNQIVDELVTLINPERLIPEFISRLTGITNEMVEDSPKFYEIAKKIIEITEGAVFVAHNAAFDYGIIKHEFETLGFEYKRETMCTVKLSRSMLPGHDSYSLGNICSDLNIHIEGRHRAGGDALATVKLLEIIIGKNGGVVPESDKEKPLSIQSLNPLLKIDEVKELSSDAGVYYFKNEVDDVIYVGKSKNVKARVFNHLKGGKTQKSEQLRYEITEVDCVETGSELIALLKEADEIKRLQPKYNKALKKNKYRFGLHAYRDRKGYCRLIIKKSNSSETPILMFSSQEQATQRLHKLIDDYELCQKMSGLYDGNNGCFQYQLKQCRGACIGEEDPDRYNERVGKMIQSQEFGYKNVIIIEKGRSVHELSAVYVENGSYKGFGYFDKSESFSSPEDFLNIISAMDDTRDARQIIGTYLKKNKPLKIISF